MPTPDDISLDQVKALLPLCSKEEQAVLQVAKKAENMALQAVNEAPTEATIKNYRAAKEFLSERFAALSAKYQPPAPAEPAEGETGGLWSAYQPTSNRLEVYRYLASHGWGLSQRTFYRHVESGKLVKNGEGLYTRRAVKKYAETWAVLRSGQTPVEEEQDLAATKTRAEIARINKTLERETFELDVKQGKYILRDDVYMEMASMVVIFEAAYDHMAYTRAAEFVATVKGDQALTEQLITTLLAAKDDMFASISNTREWEITFNRSSNDDHAEN